MRAFRKFAPLALLVLATSACLDTIAPARDRVGLMTVRAFNNSGTPVVRGTATFYRVSGLALQPLQVEQCTPYAYNPNGVGVQVETLNAGNFLTFTVAGSSVGADQIQVNSFIRYEMEAGQYLDFTAGDSITVSAPGAIDGFEPTTIKVRLAEPFTADTIPDLVSNQPLNLTWTPAPAPGSFMIAQLRYNSDGSSSEPNVEIVCIFTDDGTGEVPFNTAQAYGNADPNSRSFLFTRAREAYVTFDTRTRTRIRSLYDFPTPALFVPGPVVREP